MERIYHPYWKWEESSLAIFSGDQFPWEADSSNEIEDITID